MMIDLRKMSSSTCSRARAPREESSWGLGSFFSGNADRVQVFGRSSVCSWSAYIQRGSRLARGKTLDDDDSVLFNPPTVVDLRAGSGRAWAGISSV